MRISAEAWKLFAQFFRFGCFTFGGGWSIVAQMRERYVEREGTLTNEDLLDLTSIGRSLPGTMIGNIAMFYGYRRAGLPGGAACVLGMILPPTLILLGITYGYAAFQGNVWTMAAMRGVRAAVVPIILSALAAMVRGAFRFPPCAAVAPVTFALYAFPGVSSVWLVLLGAVCGLLICEGYERRGAERHGPDRPA